jgi:cellulose biosynthesis protein BcsQ
MGKVIAVAQQKGGAGKTMLAAQIAVALAESASVAVLDIDPQGSLTGASCAPPRRKPPTPSPSPPPPAGG